MGYLDGARPRTPSAAKVAAIWPTVLDQPFDLTSTTGLALGSRIAGFGTRRGMQWTGRRPTGVLATGTRVPGASGWVVVATPGHTDDSIALWHETSRTLLSGDAVLSARGHAWITPETVDSAAARSTAEHLQGLPVAHLLPGHGRPVHADHVWASVRN